MTLKKDFTVAFQLSAVSRYSRDYMAKPESVLEHIGFCTFYGLLLANRVNAVTHVDFGQLFMRIATHDLDEAILGDIPRTTKYFNNDIRTSFKSIEAQTMQKLAAWMDADIYSDWAQSKDNSIEGQILRVTDIASVTYKVWTEIEMLNNRSFLRVALETHKYLLEFDRANLLPLLAKEIEDLAGITHEIINGYSSTEGDRLFMAMRG